MNNEPKKNQDTLDKYLREWRVSAPLPRDMRELLEAAEQQAAQSR